MVSCCIEDQYHRTRSKQSQEHSAQHRSSHFPACPAHRCASPVVSGTVASASMPTGGMDDTTDHNSESLSPITMRKNDHHLAYRTWRAAFTRVDQCIIMHVHLFSDETSCD